MGNVNVTDISGQVAIGSNISQTQTLSIEDKKNLYQALKDFGDEISKINLPPTQSEIIRGNLKAAIAETTNEKPDIKTVGNRFHSVLDSIKETGNLIETVSKWDWTKKVIKILCKAGLSIIL